MMIEYLCQIETNQPPAPPLTSFIHPIFQYISSISLCRNTNEKNNDNNTNYNNSVLDRPNGSHKKSLMLVKKP